MAQAVINQITERVVRGAAPNTSDILAFSALSIVRVGLSSSTTDFTPTTDFILTDGEADWSPTGREPSAGQTYFVTYTFQPASSFKDFETVSREMEVDLNSLQPEADTKTGQVIRNAFIDVPARQLTDLFSTAANVAAIQSLKNIADFTDEQIEGFAFNFNEARRSATFSTGFARFNLAAVSTEPVLIPSQTRISTLATSTQGAIFFRTQADATVLPGQTFVLAAVQSEVAGASGNVGANTVTILNTPILGVSSVTNPNATAGGRDQESNQEFSDRLRQSFLASDRATFRGIRREATGFENVIDALVVGAGNPILERGGGTGGKVDVYVQAEAGLSREAADTLTFSASPVLLSNQPAMGVSAVTVNGLPAGGFALAKDAGVLADSTRALDSVQVVGASPGDAVVITYTYNGLLNDIQDALDADGSALPGRDLLVRSASRVFVDVTVSVVPAPGFAFDAVAVAVGDALAAFISDLRLGVAISYKDVFDTVAAISGVLDVRPITLLSRSGQGTAETIQLLESEFPEAGAITVRRA